MKTIISGAIVGAIIIGILLFNTPGCQNTISHAKSSWIGLNREITLYNASGNIIKQWSTDAKIEDMGGSCRFMVNGKVVTISGTFIIEEK